MIPPLPEISRTNIIGLSVAATDYQGAVDWIAAAAQNREKSYAVEAANTHVAALSRHDSTFGKVMESFDLITPDGMPLLWLINAKRRKEDKLTDRVYGPTLMLKTFEASTQAPFMRHFLLGGKESTLQALKKRLHTDFPDAAIVGSYSPPFGEWPEGEFEHICQMISQSGATLVWVGLGCPKQERWIAAHKHLLPPAVYFGIGAAFAFHAGEVAQAPHWIQKRGLEWLYRLCKEPRRLFKRYFVYNFLFIWYLFFGKQYSS